MNEWGGGGAKRARPGLSLSLNLARPPPPSFRSLFRFAGVCLFTSRAAPTCQYRTPASRAASLRTRGVGAGGRRFTCPSFHSPPPFHSPGVVPCFLSFFSREGKKKGVQPRRPPSSVTRPRRPHIHARPVSRVAPPARAVAFASHPPLPALTPRRLILAREIRQGGGGGRGLVGRGLGGGGARVAAVGLAPLPPKEAPVPARRVNPGRVRHDVGGRGVPAGRPLGRRAQVVEGDIDI